MIEYVSGFLIAKGFLLFFMVLILDGNSELVARMKEKKEAFRILNIRFVTTLDLIKCLKHIKYQRLLLKIAPISVLPYKNLICGCSRSNQMP